MTDQSDRQHVAELIEKLRERIKVLDRDQSRAMELAADITMNKKETQDFEDRGKDLNDLRRELLDLIHGQKAS